MSGPVFKFKHTSPISAQIMRVRRPLASVSRPIGRVAAALPEVGAPLAAGLLRLCHHAATSRLQDETTSGHQAPFRARDQLGGGVQLRLIVVARRRQLVCAIVWRNLTLPPSHGLARTDLRSPAELDTISCLCLAPTQAAPPANAHDIQYTIYNTQYTICICIWPNNKSDWRISHDIRLGATPRQPAPISLHCTGLIFASAKTLIKQTNTARYDHHNKGPMGGGHWQGPCLDSAGGPLEPRPGAGWLLGRPKCDRHLAVELCTGQHGCRAPSCNCSPEASRSRTNSSSARGPMCAVAL